MVMPEGVTPLGLAIMLDAENEGKLRVQSEKLYYKIEKFHHKASLSSSDAQYMSRLERLRDRAESRMKRRRRALIEANENLW